MKLNLIPFNTFRTTDINHETEINDLVKADILIDKIPIAS